MTELAEVIAGIEDFSIEGQEKVVMDWIAEKGYHTGNIMNAFRLTLVGEGKEMCIRDRVYVYLKNHNEALLEQMAAVMADKLRAVFGNRVLGPDKPPVARIQTLFIKKIVVKIEQNAPMGLSLIHI